MECTQARSYSAAKRPLAGWVPQIWVETLKGWYDMMGAPTLPTPEAALQWARDNGPYGNGERRAPTPRVPIEDFLRLTQADQGGQASFEDWVKATARDDAEYGHDEAVEYLVTGGDLSQKDWVGGKWVSLATET